MGYVRVKAMVGPSRDRAKEVELLADSGSFYTIVPPGLAKSLGMRPTMKVSLTLADKRPVEAQLSLAFIRLLDREGGFSVAIMDVPEPLLGVEVLEGLGLRVDPSTGKVEHSRPYGLAALWLL